MQHLCWLDERLPVSNVRDSDHTLPPYQGRGRTLWVRTWSTPEKFSGELPCSLPPLRAATVQHSPKPGKDAEYCPIAMRSRSSAKDLPENRSYPSFAKRSWRQYGITPRPRCCPDVDVRRSVSGCTVRSTFSPTPTTCPQLPHICIITPPPSQPAGFLGPRRRMGSFR